jgi:hypothetical protein
MLQLPEFGFNLSEVFKDWPGSTISSKLQTPPNLPGYNLCDNKNWWISKIHKLPGCYQLHNIYCWPTAKMESFSRTLQIDSHGKASTIKLFSFARPHMRALHLVRIIALEYYLIYKDDICLFTLK